MSYFRTCPDCGANLDPEEICDCKRKAAPSVTSTESGEVEIRVQPTLFPPPLYQKNGGKSRMSNRAIMEFGEMLTKSKNIFTAGASGPIFAWAAPGDIVICGEAPENFHGRVCSVKFPDEETSLLCRLYKDGENVRVGYMDDYDIWKSYPASAVTVRYEVLAVVHQYGPMEPPKAETAWEKRVKQAAEEALNKFRFEDYTQIIQHHRSGRTFETLAAAFAIGYQAGKEEAGR